MPSSYHFFWKFTTLAPPPFLFAVQRSFAHVFSPSGLIFHFYSRSPFAFVASFPSFLSSSRTLGKSGFCVLFALGPLLTLFYLTSPLMRLNVFSRLRSFPCKLISSIPPSPYYINHFGEQQRSFSPLVSASSHQTRLEHLGEILFLSYTRLNLFPHR